MFRNVILLSVIGIFSRKTKSHFLFDQQSSSPLINFQIFNFLNISRGYSSSLFQGYLLSSSIDFLAMDSRSLSFTWFLMLVGWILPNILILSSHVIVITSYRSPGDLVHLKKALLIDFLKRMLDRWWWELLVLIRLWNFELSNVQHLFNSLLLICFCVATLRQALTRVRMYNYNLRSWLITKNQIKRWKSKEQIKCFVS